MKSFLRKDKDYHEFISKIKNRIQSAQIKASVLVNQELILLYWEIADKIVEKQETAKWGTGFIAQMSNDLQKEFPDIKGFSLTNIKYIRQWYLFWGNKSKKANSLLAKTVKFKPEFAGKLNFYVFAVDGILKTEKDNSTIGILICKSKKKTVVEYSLKDIHKPIGISEYKISNILPDKLKTSLPAVEEIEAELGDIETEEAE